VLSLFILLDRTAVRGVTVYGHFGTIMMCFYSKQTLDLAATTEFTPPTPPGLENLT
jgi:hypothetical protein